MLIVPEGHNIILIGGWNRRLLTPQWVAKEIAEVKEVGLEIPVGDPNLPLRLVFGDTVLSVGADRLQLHSKNPTDEKLDGLRDLAMRVLGRLPHTPVSALGVNFQWRESEPSQELVALFDFDDNHRLGDMDAEVGESRIRRELRIDGQLLHLTLILTAEARLMVDLNHHWAVESAADAEKHLAEGIVGMRNRAREFLHELYGLEEGEDQ